MLKLDRWQVVDQSSVRARGQSDARMTQKLCSDVNPVISDRQRSEALAQIMRLGRRESSRPGLPSAGGLATRETADWQSALQTRATLTNTGAVGCAPGGQEYPGLFIRAFH